MESLLCQWLLGDKTASKNDQEKNIAGCVCGHFERDVPRPGLAISATSAARTSSWDALTPPCRPWAATRSATCTVRPAPASSASSGPSRMSSLARAMLVTGPLWRGRFMARKVNHFKRRRQNKDPTRTAASASSTTIFGNRMGP